MTTPVYFHFNNLAGLRYKVFILIKSCGKLLVSDALFCVEQASKDPNEVMFHNVKPGSYKVKVEALGEICYYQHCPPILSADINVEFQG